MNYEDAIFATRVVVLKCELLHDYYEGKNKSGEIIRGFKGDFKIYTDNGDFYIMDKHEFKVRYKPVTKKAIEMFEHDYEESIKKERKIIADEYYGIIKKEKDNE